MTLYIVTITWPDDPERGSETYGPFPDRAAQAAWVTGCERAAAEGGACWPEPTTSSTE